MPTPTPVGQRIAYDDPNVAQVFFRSDRDYGAFGYDWVEGQHDALTAMNTDLVKRRGLAVLDTAFADPKVDERWIYINFSEPMEIQGYSFIAFATNGNHSGGNGRGVIDPAVSIYWTPNSTNGTDGDWYLLNGAVPPLPQSDYTAYPDTTYEKAFSLTSEPLSVAPQRLFNTVPSILSVIQATDLRNVLGLRIQLVGGVNFVFGSGNFAQNVALGLYLYGNVQPNGADTLDFWHPNRGELLPPGYLDWGDVQVASSEDKAFRLRNRSDSLSAHDVVISAESFFQIAAPEDQFLFSFDQEKWTPTLTVAALSPGTASPRVYVRRVTPAAQAQTYTNVRFRADVGRWS